MTPLNTVLATAIGERRVTDVAREWGVPRWVLYDILQGKTRIPGGRYLVPIAAGLGVSVDELLTQAAPAKRKVATA